jgi:leader peptidase (prepilin peptidase)/N-methyltransferase
MDDATLAALGLLGPPAALVWGSLWGSFLNVVVHRLPRGESLVRPGSRCPGCGKGIRAFDNVPVLSWLILRGKCRDCAAPISPRYPMVEALTAVISLALFHHHVTLGPQAAPLVALLAPYLLHFAFAAALIAITFIDLDIQIVPNSITFPFMALGLISAALLPDVPFLEAVVGLILGYGVIVGISAAYKALRGADGMGGGDAKLLGMIGAWLGYRSFLFLILAGSLQGLLMAALLGVLRRLGLNVGLYDASNLDDDDESAALPKAGEDQALGQLALPFGPYLALAALEWILVGEPISEWYIDLVAGLLGVGEGG